MSEKLIDFQIQIGGKKYTLESCKAPDSKGVVWKGRDKWESPVAIKFAIIEDYEDRSFLQEATKAKKLRGYPRFAQLIDVEVIILPLTCGDTKFVCFIEEWIDGDTLEDFLKTRQFSSSFLLEFIRMMCEALSNLYYLDLCHDDLHAKNIMLSPPKPGSLEPHETQVKIIDMGSLKSDPFKKEKKDHYWFVQHIVNIRNTIYKKKRLSSTEKRYLNEIIPLLEKMLDDDKEVALTDPSKILQQFEITWMECKYSIEEREEKIKDPFFYISAETIRSDKLLVELFAESCPWKSDVLSPDPIVLTGPRGCGKSTIFRRMSLKGMLFKDEEEIIKSNIVGFYISCTSDLRNRVNWINNENLSRRFKGDIIHYFNLLLTKEIISTLIIIAKREDRESLFGFSKDAEYKLYKFLVEKLMIKELDRLRLQGVTPMIHALELLENEMDKCHVNMVRRQSVSYKTQSSYLSDLTNYLSINIKYLKERKIAFFLDDLSTRQIPEEVQTVINDVLFERAKNHIFKIASDKYGWIGLDSLSAVGEKTREFKEVDCAKFFLVEADKNQKEQFTRELLAKRLNLSRYKGTPEEIIGPSKYHEGSLGKAIRIRSDQGKRVNNVYFGLETITDLCCGDISVLLEIYRRIFLKGKIDINSHNRVSRYNQHEVIKSISREMYNHILSYRPYGENMLAIVTWFGTLSKGILRKAKMIHQRDSSVVPQTTRIEIDEDPRQPQIGFTETQKSLLVELVRRAIFIELDPGSARRTSTPSLRLQLRPILCPTFMTTPYKTFPIKWTPEEFKYFLNDPEDKCNYELKKMIKQEDKGVEATSLFYFLREEE